MCIIVVKKHGIELPKDFDKIVTNCYYSNPDGAGFMIKRAGTKKVLLKKGYMNLIALKSALDDAKIGRMDEFVLHCRIGTSGLKNAAMTHPFVVSTHPMEIKATNGLFEKPCIAHNGIFYSYSKGDADINSDTYYFVKDLLSKWEEKMGNRKLKRWRKKLRSAISYNKLAILYPDQDLELIGRFIYSNGLFFSNAGYKNSYWNAYNTEEYDAATCSI